MWWWFVDGISQTGLVALITIDSYTTYRPVSQESPPIGDGSWTKSHKQALRANM